MSENLKWSESISSVINRTEQNLSLFKRLNSPPPNTLFHNRQPRYVPTSPINEGPAHRPDDAANFQRNSVELMVDERCKVLYQEVINLSEKLQCMDVKLRANEEMNELRPSGFYDLEQKVTNEIRGIKKELGSFLRPEDLKVTENSLKSIFSLRTDAVEERLRDYEKDLEESKGFLMSTIEKRTKQGGPTDTQIIRELETLRDDLSNAIAFQLEKLKGEFRVNVSNTREELSSYAKLQIEELTSEFRNNLNKQREEFSTLIQAMDKRSKETLAEHQRHIIELQHLIQDNVTTDEFNEKIKQLFTNFDYRLNEVNESQSKTHVQFQSSIHDLGSQTADLAKKITNTSENEFAEQQQELVYKIEFLSAALDQVEKKQMNSPALDKISQKWDELGREIKSKANTADLENRIENVANNLANSLDSGDVKITAAKMTIDNLQNRLGVLEASVAEFKNGELSTRLGLLEASVSQSKFVVEDKESEKAATFGREETSQLLGSINLAQSQEMAPLSKTAPIQTQIRAEIPPLNLPQRTEEIEPISNIKPFRTAEPIAQAKPKASPEPIAPIQTKPKIQDIKQTREWPKDENITQALNALADGALELDSEESEEDIETSEDEEYPEQPILLQQPVHNLILDNPNDFGSHITEQSQEQDDSDEEEDEQGQMEFASETEEESYNLDNADIASSDMEEEEMSVQDFADNILVDLLGLEMEYCINVVTKNDLEMSRQKTPMSVEWDTDYDDDLAMMSGRRVKGSQLDYDFPIIK